MRKIADAIRDNFCSFFETEVTSMFIRFSILTCVRSPGEDCGAGCDRELCPHAASHPSRRSKTVAPVTRARSHLFRGSYPHATSQRQRCFGSPSLLQSVLSRFAEVCRFSESVT